jgi:allantoin racemase
MAAPRPILLINPNSSQATTTMMLEIASSAIECRRNIIGATATRSPAMIVEPSALLACAPEVLEIALARAGSCGGLIVAAFGDPGLAEIRARISIPSVGIGESAFIAAAQGGRRFGVATTTPALATQIDALPAALGLQPQYTGSRFTEGDPHDLITDPSRLRAALAEAVRLCVEQDGAEAVIIGGGPLGRAAAELQPTFAVPIIAPIPAALTRLIGIIGR